MHPAFSGPGVRLVQRPEFGMLFFSGVSWAVAALAIIPKASLRESGVFIYLESSSPVTAAT
jgi:hypothetical protein